MTKVALLIGVSEYEPGLDPLPAAIKDVEAMQQVLANPEMGGFAAADITVLPNPDRQTMEDAIDTLFANRQKDDLVLFYFSGHGVVDDSGDFYFATRFTRKDQGRLLTTKAVAAGSVQKMMEKSRSKRQVIILDSCFSGAFVKGATIKDIGSVNLEKFLGGKGRAILTASTSTQYAFTQDGFDLSVYTHYLVEGIRTGGADLDNDGSITVDELHTYVKSKVIEAAPAMTPECYPVQEGSKIILAKSPKDDPQLKYRKEVKLLAQEDEGDFSRISRAYLDELQWILGLPPELTIAIETEELEPYRQRRAKVDHYRTVFEGAIAHRYPLSDRDRVGLQRLQQVLSLRDEDIAAIEAPILSSKQAEYEQQQAAARQEQESKRLLQEQAKAAERQRVEQQRQEAERLQQEQETKRLQQEQAKAIEAERQRVERQRQEAERLQQEQAKAQADNTRSTVSPQPGRSIPRPPQTLRQPEQTPTITRQQFLKWAGFGGGGLTIALLGNQVIQSQKALQLLTRDFETVTVDDKGQIIKLTPAKAEFVQEDLGNEIALEMVAIPAGEFLMGTVDAADNTDEMPQHRVQLSAFWMGRYAITQAQWRQVARLPKVKRDLKVYPSIFKGVNRPVETVSWEEAVEFCDRLSRKTGNPYRLASEAEWEYACRAGTTTPFHFGATITSDLVNCDSTNPYGNAPKGESRRYTTDVGTFPPNGFGLHDMHGNVWEWCADPWHDNYQGAPTNGSVWTTNGNNEGRVIRGGSWLNLPRTCRSACRSYSAPGFTYHHLGFRVVCSAPRTLA